MKWQAFIQYFFETVVMKVVKCFTYTYSKFICRMSLVSSSSDASSPLLKTDEM